MAWIAALAAAASSYMSAKQANKGSKSWTDQVTQQTPYGAEILGNDLDAVLNRQRELFNNGPNFIQGGQPGHYGTGNYASQFESSAPGPLEWGFGPHPPPPTNSGGGGGDTGGNPAARQGSRAARQAAAQAPGRHGGGSTTGGGGGGRGGGRGNNDIQGMAHEIYQQGIDADNTPTMNQSRNTLANIMGAAGTAGGSAGAGERTGFEGYNPILDRLARNYEDEPQNADDMLRNFLSGDYSRAGGGGGGSSTGGGGRGGGYGPPAYMQQMHDTGRSGSGAGMVPDTMARQSYFGDQVRRLMDEKTNEADIQTLIDQQNADLNRGMAGQLWDLDAQSQGTGRFGGDMWKGLSNDTRRATAQEMLRGAAGTRLSEQEARRQLYENLLGQVNTRDISAMQDATNRYQADQSAAAASAGAGASADAARRGQDLQALSLLMQNQQYNQGQLGDIGARLSTDRLGAVGLTPDLEGVNLGGLGAANSSVGNLVGLRGAQIAAGTQRGIANGQLGLAYDQMNQQAQMFNAQAAQNQVNDYLNMIRGIGGMGGMSHTYGQNVQPGLGVNPYAAAAAGGAAAYANYQGNR